MIFLIVIFLSNGFSLKLAPVPCAIPEWPIDFNPCRPIVSAWSCPTGTLRAEPPFVFFFTEEEKSRLCPNRVNCLKPPQPELPD